jgi:hypothetical protein
MFQSLLNSGEMNRRLIFISAIIIFTGMACTERNNVFFLTPLGNGKYIDSTLGIEAGKRYDLSFMYNSMTVSAYTTIPSKPVNFTGLDSDTINIVVRSLK